MQQRPIVTVTVTYKNKYSLKKKLLAFISSFSFLILLGFGAAAVAAVTISGTGITGDSNFNTITTASSTAIDTGSSNTALSLQSGHNGPITTGSGLFTFGGNVLLNTITNALLYATTTGQLSPVTIGNNLTFSGGVLSATGGGGAGNPGGTNGQMQINSRGSFAGQATNMSGGGSSVFQRGIECATGTVSLSGGTWTYPGGTTSAAASISQEIPIVTGLNGNQRFTSVLAAESTKFTSGSVTNTKISIGRTGISTDDELLPQTDFMVSSGNAWFAEDRPQTPILGSSNTYNLVLAIRTTGGNVSALSAGAVYYEVCGYQTP